MFNRVQNKHLIIYKSPHSVWRQEMQNRKTRVSKLTHKIVFPSKKSKIVECVPLHLVLPSLKQKLLTNLWHILPDFAAFTLRAYKGG